MQNIIKFTVIAALFASFGAYATELKTEICAVKESNGNKAIVQISSPQDKKSYDKIIKCIKLKGSVEVKLPPQMNQANQMPTTNGMQSGPMQGQMGQSLPQGQVQQGQVQGEKIEQPSQGSDVSSQSSSEVSVEPTNKSAQ